MPSGVHAYALRRQNRLAAAIFRHSKKQFEELSPKMFRKRNRSAKCPKRDVVLNTQGNNMQFIRMAAQILTALFGFAGVQGAMAQDAVRPDMGKLLATGGVSQVEGAGGGGLTPWALITGYGTRDSYGANAN
jgi:hypothetical protein